MQYPGPDPACGERLTESIQVTLPLQRWQGDRGIYHLVTIDGEPAEDIAMHAQLHRLEFGRQRGFGSVRVIASVGRTEWKSSVFPQKKSSEWALLISKKVMHAESLSAGDAVEIALKLL